MDTWLDRLIVEQKQLAEKFTKLKTHLSDSDASSTSESTKLKIDQLYYMEQYLDILNRRLRLEPEGEIR